MSKESVSKHVNRWNMHLWNNVLHIDMILDREGIDILERAIPAMKELLDEDDE